MSDYLDPNNEELLKDYFSEAQQNVDTLEQNMLELEKGFNKDTVDEIFRAAHTLKSSSATVEFMEINKFAHTVEDVFDAIRSDQLAVTEDVMDVLFQGIDTIKAMLEQRMNGAVYQEDTKALEASMEALIPGKGGAQPASPKAAAAKSTPPAPPPQAGGASNASPLPVGGAGGGLSPEEMAELKSSAGGKPVFKVTVKFDEASPMNSVGPIQLYSQLKGDGTVLKTNPDFEALYEDVFRPSVDYYFATTKDAEYIKKSVVIPDVSLSAEVSPVNLDWQHEGTAAPTAPVVSTGSTTGKAAPAPQAPVAATPAKPAPSPAAKSAAAAEAAKAGKEASSILRVDSRRIDDLLNLVSETVITKATFNQISMQFNNLQSVLRNDDSLFRERIKSLLDELPDMLEAIQKGKNVKDIRKQIAENYADLFNMFDNFSSGYKENLGKFRATSQNLGRLTGELQEKVMRIRMVPISQIFSRFPRMVRDLCKQTGKKVNLVIEGEETELDKSVIEDLQDPLMHSIRNAVDHGVESPEERVAAGKPETGMVLLKASNEGNMIIIEVGDDGAGIDVQAVKDKAVQKGLISPNKIITDQEAYQLIFDPGFSTSKTITSISGRGVGLDVVKRSIEKLNGTVTVQSQHGKGTTFVIKLPLTLAIIQGLLVRVGPEIYSIPITSVIESVRIKPEDIQKIDNYEVFNIRNEVISLLRLNRLFGIKTEEQTDYHFIVVVGTEEKKMGFMVDSLIGEEDVVIKPLRDQYTNSPGIAGASILGDGSVSLIIDVSQLLDLGLRKEQEQQRIREATIR
ncbi:MAG: chemotaxis protein CheA [Spirochaetaceae bacterium]|jgi:two-component system chemotaxis sensor kinase CheA|nr:chemotaxis protein CheA [Spirochaetaceae bacterium]